MATSERKVQRQITARTSADTVSPAGARPASAPRATSGFSSDPSPFTRRPTLGHDTSAYREFVALAAYYRAERRGFAPGHEVEDWLEAEREVSARMG